MVLQTNFSIRPKQVALAVAAAFGIAASPASAAPEQSPATPIYAATEAGKPLTGLDLANDILRAEPTNAAVLEARAYTLRGLKRYPEALADYLRMLDLNPGSRTGLIGTVICLRAVGAAQLAQQYEQRQPGIFANAEVQALDLSVAGSFTRMGITDPKTGLEAFDLTDRAIQGFNTSAKELTAGDAAALPGFAAYDYVVAKFNRHQYADAVEVFERIRQLRPGQALPDYVVHVAAQSYSSMKNPVRSLELLDPIAERNKDDIEFVQNYFYNLVDNDEHARARAWIDAAVSRTPVYLDEAYPRLRRANPGYVRLVTFAAWSRAFNDQLGSAKKDFLNALAEAPANESLRTGAATVSLWSGRPLEAREHFLRALALNPTSMEARRGLVSVQAARGDERGVRQALKTLLEEHPLDGQLLRAKADQDLREGPSVSFSAGRSTSHIATGTTAPEMSGRFRLNSTRYSDIWRVFATTSGNHSAPDGERIPQVERSLGLDMKLEDIAATAAITKNLRGRTGLTASARWAPADGVALRVEGETVTPDVAARALEQGVFGHRAGLSGEWQPGAATWLAASLSRTSLSDENEMTSLSLRWKQMWFQDAKHQYWTAASLYHFTASNQDVSYFSPERDDLVTVTLGASLLGSRQASRGRSLWHHVEVDAGQVRQQNYSAVLSGALRYRLSWQYSPRISGDVSLERARRVYDGTPEMQDAIRLNLSIAL